MVYINVPYVWVYVGSCILILHQSESRPIRGLFLAKIAFGVTSLSVSLWLIWCLDSFRSKPGMHWTTQVWYQFWWILDRSLYSTFMLQKWAERSCWDSRYIRYVYIYIFTSTMRLYEKVKSCRLSVDHHWEMIRDGERLPLAKASSNTDEMKTSGDLWRSSNPSFPSTVPEVDLSVSPWMLSQ